MADTTTIAEKIAQAESERQRIAANIAAAYDEAEAKGATMPVTENSDNLADTMASIPEAVQPTLITKQITSNGTYAAEDETPPADGYSEVTVDVQPLFNADGTMYLADMSIPNTVTEIKDYAYQNCKNMQSLEIAGTVKTIRKRAFSGCNITDLILHEGIETLHNGVFAENSCEIFVLPSTIISIDTYCFRPENVPHIIDLSAFTDPNSIPTLNSVLAFDSGKLTNLLVANQEMLEAFEAATNWSIYAGKYVIKGASS